MASVVGHSCLNRLPAPLVSGQGFYLGERFEHETGVKVIDEIADLVACVKPGPVGLLRRQHKVEVALGDAPVIVAPELNRRACEQERPVGAGVDDAPLVVEGIIARRGDVRREFPVFDVLDGVVCDRPHDFQPSRVTIDSIYRRKGFVDIGRGGDERRADGHDPSPGDPIERITPAVMLVVRTAGLFEDVQKVDRPVVVFVLADPLRQERETHGVMRVGDGKALFSPKKLSCGRQQSFGQNHRRNRHSPQQRYPVVQCLRSASDGASEKALMIAGRFTVAIKPDDEVAQDGVQGIRVG